MSGLKYLLDTNIIIGLLKQNLVVVEYLSVSQPELDACAYSAITRMELLGFPGITHVEVEGVQRLLNAMRYVPLDCAVEDAVIQIRQSVRLKLPDAIIAATAKIHGLQLLTLDQKLQTCMVGFDVA
jgi:predicted nucleic acid-binding protein